MTNQKIVRIFVAVTKTVYLDTNIDLDEVEEWAGSGTPDDMDVEQFLEANRDFDEMLEAWTALGLPVDGPADHSELYRVEILD